MVSWARMFYDGSGHPGVVGAYQRIVTSSPTLKRRALWAGLSSNVVLASPGTVDANVPTRMQYSTSLGLPIAWVAASMQFVAADFSAHPGKVLGVGVFLAPASDFAAGVVPTPVQIRSAANARTIRTQNTDIADPNYGQNPARLSSPGFLRASQGMIGVGEAYEPNKKYWVMVCPIAFDLGSDGSVVANNVPVGDVNVNGRAVSVWTNRTPLAPVITAPTGQATIFAGAQVELAFSPRDPDRIASFKGDAGINDFEDVAGVQIQFSPADTEDWTDLPIANESGTAFGSGWWIDDNVSLPATSGAKAFWQTFKLTIRCGNVEPLGPKSAYLPSGKWKIRVRTFDYGHAWSDSDNITVSPPGTAGLPPLDDADRDYDPNTYPADNTSPWSEPITILISEQVPKPLALTPVNNIAIVEGTPVSLVWQYRNTYSPPYPQGARVIHMRKVGDPVWTTVNVALTSSQSWVVSGFPLVSGNAYQWRVLVQDTSGVNSAYSDPATFWVVPVPDSGDVLPSPGELLDGATLGCGTHRVEFYRRGGKVKVGEVRKLSYVKWGRVRDDITGAKIVVSDYDVDCGEMLKNLKTWAHEIKIWRDNGFSVKPVWEGPITLLTYTDTAVTVQARDVGVYPYRRIVKQRMNDSGNSPTKGDTVTSRAARVIQNVMAPDDPNVLAYLTVVTQDDDAKQYRSLAAYSRTAYEEIDDMAANAGLDYTVVGRRIILWGTKHRIGTLPEFRDKDLGAKPIVSEYGMSASNVYAVSDGNGIYGEADRLNDTDTDPIYGLIEVLSSTWASDSESEEGTYTQEGIETIKESFADAAERSIADKYPPPVVVRVPDNTRLHPDTVVDINQLVPGVIIPLRSTSTLRHVVASQKLDSVTVVEQNGEETITVTMSPFSRDDRAPNDGEGEE